MIEASCRSAELDEFKNKFEISGTPTDWHTIILHMERPFAKGGILLDSDGLNCYRAKLMVSKKV
jgi:hypothetical protein